MTIPTLETPRLALRPLRMDDFPAYATIMGSLPTLVSYFDPENNRSMAVSARLGGVRDDSAPLQDEGDVVYRYWRN
jgi:RimJ/RimL family protein N-acetyltransferase